MENPTKGVDHVVLSSEIVSAYVSNNPIPAGDLPSLIASVHEAVTRAATGVIDQPTQDLIPAVPIKKSVTPDYIVCLEDGKQFKSLKRHLRTRYGMTPEDYRAKWSLPYDYPMVAPNYAAARSQLAKEMGLGSMRRSVIEPEPEPTPEETPPSRTRRRSKKAEAAES